MAFRQKIFNIIDEENKETNLSRFFNFLIIGMILLNVFAIILESFENLRLRYEQEFYYFEIFSVAIFTIEYLARLLTADKKYPEKSKVGSVITYVMSPLAVVDLLAILPTYLPLLITIDLRFIRLLRLLRITRLFKINRYSRSLKLIGSVFKEKSSDLGITFFL